MLRRGWTAALAMCAVLAVGSVSFYVNMPAGATTSETESDRVLVAPGYAISAVAEQLTTPVGVAVGPRGAVFVAEAGAATGTPPRVVKLGPGKRRATLADDFAAPLTGITAHEGKLYVSYVGGVDVLDPATGLHHPVLTRLPALGDYPNNGVTVAPDGKLYFGIGSATNAGVVGLDNIRSGWVRESAAVHDIPCKSVQLRGSNFTVANPLTPDPLDKATTGAFSPFGQTTGRLQGVAGAVPCTGAVLRSNPDGTDLEMVAWGLRNPFGLAVGPDQQLYATMQGFEDRGSRPVVNDKDYLYRVDQERWYGWPDYAGGRSVTEEDFQKPALPAKPLLAKVPEQPPAPVATFDNGSGAKGLIFPPESFGLRGDALVALFGRETAVVPPGPAPGHRIVRVNPRSGTIMPFARNAEPGPSGAAPAKHTPTGQASVGRVPTGRAPTRSGTPPPGQTPPHAPRLERPIAFAAAPGGAVYVVDFGEMRPAPDKLEPVPGTGRLWQITPARTPASSDTGGHWPWALAGLVLSAAGIGLIVRR